jgi:hypothetical protein
VEITKLKSDLEAEMSCKTELESKIKELEEYVEKIQEDLKAAEKIVCFIFFLLINFLFK